ncbi:hypothetical protein OQA88_5840 [Cercophora sp. LCS_1]
MPAIGTASASDSSVEEQLQTVASWIALAALLLTAAALLNQRHLRIRESDRGRDAADPAKVGIFYVNPPSYFQVIRGRQTVLPSVPTISSLIRAGDLGLWTSATLDCIEASPGRPGWVPLMESLVCSIALAQQQSPCHELVDLALSPEMRLLLDRSKELLVPNHRLVSRLGFYAGPNPKLINCVRNFDRSERNPKDSRTATLHVHPAIPTAAEHTCTPPVSQISSSSTSMSPLLIEATPLWLLQSHLCVPISSLEILTLAAALGIPLSINDFTQHIHGTGPVNSSLSVNLTASVSSNVATLSIGHAPSSLPRNVNGSGSGYTPTFAKHIAFGCVPFAENGSWIRAVYVTEGVLKGIKEGRSIRDATQGYGGASMGYLWDLPAAREVDAMYHCVDGWGSDGQTGELKTLSGQGMQVETGMLKGKGGKGLVRATWQRAVVGIAFGGLVPQAGRLLVEAVDFTVGGTNLGGCIDELENLMDDLHELDAGDEREKRELFGDLVRDRCRLRDNVSGMDVSKPMRWGTAKAAAIFHRYMTLLESVAARCNLVGGDNTGEEEEREHCERGARVVERIFEESVSLMDRVYVAAVRSHLRGNLVEEAPEWKPSEAEATLLNEDLGRSLAGIRPRLSQNNGQFALRDCAIVVRSVLAAWACQVPTIRWNDEEIIDLELGPLSASEFTPRMRRLAVLADLAQIAGLG